MKKIFVAFAACALLAACGTKAATEEQTEEEVVVVEEEVEAAEEAATVAEAPAASELPTLIDLYVKACNEENEIEATRVAKRIHNEYEEQLTPNDIKRMADASAVLAAKRAEQAKETAQTVKEETTKAVDALKNLKK